MNPVRLCFVYWCVNHPCICYMHIGSVMTESVPEADPEYAEVAEEYEEDVLICRCSQILH